MDDKDGVMIGLIAMQTFVQIPLWTIRTWQEWADFRDNVCSDSSMDDKDRLSFTCFPSSGWFRFLYGR